MARFTMERKNPEGLFASSAFSQAVVISGNARTIYIGGQNGVNANGELVDRTDLSAQTRQALSNIATILSSEGASFHDLVKLNIYMLNGCDPRIGLAAFQEVVGQISDPPLITVLFVAGFARPSCLIEIDGIAVTEDIQQA